MTPYTFAGSAILVAGLLGLCLIFIVPPLGISLFGLAAAGAYWALKEKK